MKQLAEDYVSFEIAKLLKEKGFNTPCHCYYRIKKLDYGPEEEYDNETLEFDEHKSYSAPTHQMVLKWLREGYNIHISVQPDYPSKTNYKLSWCWSVNILHKNCFECKKHQSYIDTFEQAVEAGLLYVLKNLI